MFFFNFILQSIVLTFFIHRIEITFIWNTLHLFVIVRKIMFFFCICKFKLFVKNLSKKWAINLKPVKYYGKLFVFHIDSNYFFKIFFFNLNKPSFIIYRYKMSKKQSKRNQLLKLKKKKIIESRFLKNSFLFVDFFSMTVARLWFEFGFFLCSYNSRCCWFFNLLLNHF